MITLSVLLIGFIEETIGNVGDAGVVGKELLLVFNFLFPNPS